MGIFLAGVLIVAGLVVAACSTTRGSSGPKEACRFNLDCKEGLSCVASNGSRTCLAIRPLSDATCGSSEECDDGKVCKAGRCGVAPTSVLGVLEDRCEDDADCPDGRQCDLEAKRCQAIPSSANVCSSSWDCRANESCVFGRCERQAPFSGCRSDMECVGFQRCIAGRCQ